MFNSPFVYPGGGLDCRGSCLEARDIRIQWGHESYPRDGSVARQVLKQFFKLIFMSSDSIHDAVLCAERRARTPARSIDAANIKEPAYGCDCRLANGIYRHKQFAAPYFPGYR